jgi:HEAT repeat protein
VAAARALSHIAAADSLHALAGALHDRAWQVRAQAALALGALGVAGVPAVPALVTRLRDLSWWVRRNAAYSLGRMGLIGQQALASVAAHDHDAYARDAACEVLQMIEWELESPGGQARVE